MSGPINKDLYPSNRNKDKEVPEKKVEKVVSGKVIKRKKPLTKKFSEAIFNEDINDVGSHILEEIIIPNVKMLAVDIINNSAEMIFGVSPRKIINGIGKTNYNSQYSRVGQKQTKASKMISENGRARHNFEEIVYDSRTEAMDVLCGLTDLVDQYNVASVADLYHLSGINHESSDNNWGWYDLSRAKVIRTRDGYLISLPKTEVIE